MVPVNPTFVVPCDCNYLLVLIYSKHCKNMNLAETIYCSQYYEIKKNGKDPAKGRTNGTVLVAAMILLLLVSVIVVYNVYMPGNGMDRLFRGTGISGRSMGKIIGLGGLAALYAILNFTVGSKSSYERMMRQWETMPDEELKATVKKALKIFFSVFLFFIVAMIAAFAK